MRASSRKKAHIAQAKCAIPYNATNMTVAREHLQMRPPTKTERFPPCARMSEIGIDSVQGLLANSSMQPEPLAARLHQTDQLWFVKWSTVQEVNMNQQRGCIDTCLEPQQSTLCVL
ncbi:hypothetical protein SCP_0300280 [Sparassis crispa]|uniref:Uncharacterized protein n=1 Tax=Sparassis crispa TaxID=139825 RepID=A0A401GDX4_9APHY|nr:hypothetical protein SCP_0300280 [Sparassis crispa]GBE80313.1 hypothetical protein SCP_0300280 [Sparassis crispa]